jgi:hypothetical protein
VARDSTLPSGTALLIPVINSFYCALAEDPPEQQTEAYVRSQVAFVKDTASGLSLTVDGRPVRRLTYEESEIFTIVLPADNIFGLPAGTVARPCADAGYYALVPPLSVGEHTIRIQGTLGTFIVDVTYHMTVVPRGLRAGQRDLLTGPAPAHVPAGANAPAGTAALRSRGRAIRAGR